MQKDQVAEDQRYQSHLLKVFSCCKLHRVCKTADGAEISTLGHDHAETLGSEILPVLLVPGT